MLNIFDNMNKSYATSSAFNCKYNNIPKTNDKSKLSKLKNAVSGLISNKNSNNLLSTKNLEISNFSASDRINTLNSDKNLVKDNMLENIASNIDDEDQQKPSLNNCELDGFKFNFNKTEDKLVDFSKPYYTCSGEPETINYNYIPPSVESNIISSENEVDKRITEYIKSQKDFDDIIKDNIIWEEFKKNSKKV